MNISFLTTWQTQRKQQDNRKAHSAKLVVIPSFVIGVSLYDAYTICSNFQNSITIIDVKSLFHTRHAITLFSKFAIVFTCLLTDFLSPFDPRSYQ